MSNENFAELKNHSLKKHKGIHPNRILKIRKDYHCIEKTLEDLSLRFTCDVRKGKETLNY